MTRKEKEQKLLEMFNLKVGDRIKCGLIYEIVEREKGYVLHPVKYRDDDYYDISIISVIIYDWEKVDPILKDKKCKDIDFCTQCPLENHNCGAFYKGDTGEHTLGEIFIEVKRDLDRAKEKIFGDKK